MFRGHSSRLALFQAFLILSAEECSVDNEHAQGGEYAANTNPEEAETGKSQAEMIHSFEDDWKSIEN